MNSVFKFLAFSIIVLLCTACPATDDYVDYLLKNRTSDALHITTYSSWFTDGDSIEINESSVAAGFDLYLYREPGWGSGCVDSIAIHLNDLQEIFDSIIITSPIGTMATSTVFDTIRWELSFDNLDDYDCYIDLEIELTDEDFQ